MSTSALQLLRALLPADCVIHVGAGHGLGEVHAWHDWDIHRAWLIDADQDRLAWASKKQVSGTWTVLEAVLADKAGPVNFYQASNPAEDGLLAPEQLRAQWANLRTISRRQTTACTLDQLLAKSEPTHNAWVFIDCIPADLILAGATQPLANTRVVCARAIGAEGEQATSQVLAAQGFVKVARLESNHPDVGYLLFARNVLAQAESLAQSLAHALNEQSKSERKFVQLQTEHAAQRIELVAQVDQLKAELEKLKLQKNDLVARHEAGTNANAQALSQRDIHIKSLTTELQQKKLVLQALEEEALASAQECDAQAKALAKQEAQARALADEIKQLEAAQQTLQQEKETAAAAHAANAQAHAQALGQRDTQNQALNTELNHIKLALQAAEKDKAAVIAAREAEAAANAKAQVGLQGELEKAAKQQAQLVEERDALTKAKEAETSAKNQALTERDAITKAKEAETAATTKARTERDALAKEKQTLEADHKENQERLQQLEATNQDLQNRQYLQHEELVKAEAQIELIKDLLLREQGI